MAINPYLKIIGLSATVYRLGMGLLTNGPIFTDIAYDLCNIQGFSRLIAEGYLAPIFPKKTNVELDVSSVGMSSTGDFNDRALQAAVDDADITYKALTEAVQIGQSRRSWTAFASGIDHAIHIAEMLRGTFGIDAAEVHSKMPEKERDRRIDAYKRGELRCIVNKDILTTGFDHPPIDLILMLRPTMSTGLWVQMLGRGTRPYDPAINGYLPGFASKKFDCCVLDYAGNTRRLGPINDPVIPKPKGKGRAGDAPVKICDACGAYNHTSARFCLVCNNEFVMSPNIVGPPVRTNCFDPICPLSNTSTLIASSIRIIRPGPVTSRSRLRTFAGCGRFTNTLPSKATASAAKPGAIGSASARRSNRRKRTPKYWRTPRTFVSRVAFAFGLNKQPVPQVLPEGTEF
jgi:DNA repair protein RadD